MDTRNSSGKSFDLTLLIADHSQYWTIKTETSVLTDWKRPTESVVQTVGYITSSSIESIQYITRNLILSFK